MDEFGFEIAARALGNVAFEVVRHLLVGLHAPESFGPAGVAAAVLLRRPFQHAHRRTLLVCGQRRAHPGDAVPDDDDIESVAFHGHEVLPRDVRPGQGDAAAIRDGSL